MALLVIEGLDGAGKSTQIGLLQEYLKSKGQRFEYLHFPRTESPVYGDLISKFLRGELGDINQVNPYLVALIYAGDRADAKNMLHEWLNTNTSIVLDRYVYSNIAYQCAKISYPDLQNDLKKWILDTEFGYFGLPKPDLNIFLDVPFSFTEKKLKGERQGDDRSYLQGMRDIHEENLDFQKKVREVYLTLEQEDSFVRINCCSDDDTMLKPNEIFEKIISEIEKRNLFKL
jgi:dTMP kinase